MTTVCQLVILAQQYRLQVY